VLPLLVTLFVVVPIAELYVIVRVGQTIGALNTVALLLAVSIGGAWLVKREGLGVIRRFRQQTEAGAVPGREIADGVLIMLAGALLITPGFLSDVLGILLLLPPVRAVVRATLLARITRRGLSGRRRNR